MLLGVDDRLDNGRAWGAVGMCKWWAQGFTRPAVLHHANASLPSCCLLLPASACSTLHLLPASACSTLPSCCLHDPAACPFCCLHDPAACPFCPCSNLTPAPACLQLCDQGQQVWALPRELGGRLYPASAAGGAHTVGDCLHDCLHEGLGPAWWDWEIVGWQCASSKSCRWVRGGQVAGRVPLGGGGGSLEASREGSSEQSEGLPASNP